MSPFAAHATGSRATWRQSWHEAKGRKESRERRVAWEPHVDLRRERSWEVKKAREVFRLPGAEVSKHFCAPGYSTYYETLDTKGRL